MSLANTSTSLPYVYSILFLLAQLSSKDDYGYFFRTIPTELMFGRVMMEFVASRGWQKVAVFYTGDELGSQSKQRFPSHISIIQSRPLLFAQDFQIPRETIRCGGRD